MGFDSEQKLLDFMAQQSNGSVEETLCGVVFTSTFSSPTQLPKDIKYSLRFRAKTPYDDEWITERMYPVFSQPGPRAPDYPWGGRPCKLEYFILLVHHTGMAYSRIVDLTIPVAVTLGCSKICQNVQIYPLIKPIGLFDPLKHILMVFNLMVNGTTKTSWFN